MATADKIDWSQCPLVEVKSGVQSGAPVLRGTASRARPQSKSERETSRQNRIVIGGMEVGRHNLIAPAKREAHSPSQAEPSQQQPRRDKILCLAVVLSILEEG